MKKLSFTQKCKIACAQCLGYDPTHKGREVWKRLNCTLPEPVGSTAADKPRIAEFKQKIQTLPFLEYYALEKWLRFAYDDLEKNMPEHTTGATEQYHDKWRQIYREHFEAME